MSKQWAKAPVTAITLAVFMWLISCVQNSAPTPAALTMPPPSATPLAAPTEPVSPSEPSQTDIVTPLVEFEPVHLKCPTGKIIYTIEDDTFVACADGSLSQRVISGSRWLPAGMGLRSMALSPDGQKLALAACCTRDGDIITSQLVVVDLARSIVTEVGRDAAVFNDLAWSPDGQYIAFALVGDFDSIAVQHLAGHTRSLLFDPQSIVRGSATRINKVGVEAFDWSSDGEKIVYEVFTGGRVLTTKTYIADVDCSPEHECAASNATILPWPDASRYIMWTPDSESLVTNMTYGVAGNSTVEIRNRSGDILRKIEVAEYLPHAEITNAVALSLDQKLLAFCATTSGDSGIGLYVLDLDTGKVTHIADRLNGHPVHWVIEESR